MASGASAPRTRFLLYVAPAGVSKPTPTTVFYDVADESVAEQLCRLFDREYGGSHLDFHYRAADSISLDEQILLDEALDWLRLYDDPDPGIYDPRPSPQMLERAQYCLRAQGWEGLLRERAQPPCHGNSVADTGTESVSRESAGWTFSDLPDGEVRAQNLTLCQDYARLGEHDMLEISACWRSMAIQFIEATRRSGFYQGHIVHDAEVQRVTKLLEVALS